MTDDPAAAAPAPQSPLTRLGAQIGVTACLAGLLIFTIACHGVDKAFALALLPLGMGALGLLTTVVGGALRTGGPEDTPILAAIFTNLFAMIGGLLLVCAWQNWQIFPRVGGT